MIKEKKEIRGPKPKPETSETKPEKKSQNIVMTFGVFDGLHKGHKYFLNQAKKMGDKLVVIVAKDSVVERLKNKTSRYNVKERVVALKMFGSADDVREGDDTLGSWNIISRIKPQFIAVGYDQEELEFEVAAFIVESGLDIKIRKVAAFEPERYKSSLINK